MNTALEKQLLREYSLLPTLQPILVPMSQQHAVVLVIQLQVAFRSSQPRQPEIDHFTRQFCNDLLSNCHLSDHFRKCIDRGWDLTIDFNNPTTSPDELA